MQELVQYTDFRTGLQLGHAQYMVKEAGKGDDTAPSSGSPATSKGQNKLASVLSGDLGTLGNTERTPV